MAIKLYRGSDKDLAEYHTLEETGAAVDLTTATAIDGCYKLDSGTYHSLYRKRTGDISIGLPTVVITDTSDLVVGMQVRGTGIPTGTTILSLVANTSVTLTDNATVTQVGATLKFGNIEVPGSPTNYSITHLFKANTASFKINATASIGYTYVLSGNTLKGSSGAILNVVADPCA